MREMLKVGLSLLLAAAACGGNNDMPDAPQSHPDAAPDAAPKLPVIEAFYDGHAGTGAYAIGRALSTDGGTTWTRAGTAPILSPVAGSWDSDFVKDAWVVIRGSTEYLYYSGYRANTTTFQIGLATSTDGGKTFQRVGTTPVLSIGAAGSYDAREVTFPIVIYEPNAPAAEQWKLWYTAQDATGHSTIAYAKSADGMTWNKVAAVLDVGAAGDYDSNLLKTGSVFKDRDTYTLIYGGNINAAGRTRWSVGLATFTDPGQPYTKQGQIVAPLLGRLQNLTQDALAGDTTVAIASPSTFISTESVYVAQAEAQPQLTRIAAKPATGVTLRDPLALPLATAQQAAVRSIFSWSVAPRGAWFENGHWTMAVTAFQQWTDIVDNHLTEMTATAVSAGDSLSGPWALDVSRGVILEPSPSTSTWDVESSDNFMIPVGLDGAVVMLPPD